ncbi:Predicted secreted protein [Caminicella sporogenes DSM 14501]|uniref:Predicted secreted protein n=1 Tax=Caminicella sporogenes DSM 14501 TaxID=1121266 RepID=A0A1M6TMB2_9FIRM|nr:CD3072 family TudS-related putative desulfidase [Caminicella sporogenes]RKD22348.1 hypothetical protein BET04_04760 [Caminicella sporogenes]SHK58046.1 Predicted secreted protein [Caminicella sporogenes DSM 14501]
MKRSREIILLSHCILNANSKVEGLSEYSGVLFELTNLIIKRGIGIIQLPCPEMLMYGIKRWGHVKEQFDTPYFREKCRKLIQPIVNQLIDYKNSGYKILGVIGIDGSPSCGVNKTCSGNWGGEFLNNKLLVDKIHNLKFINASGIFIEEMKKIFRENNLSISFTALDETNINGSINKIKEFLDKSKSFEEEM